MRTRVLFSLLCQLFFLVVIGAVSPVAVVAQEVMTWIPRPKYVGRYPYFGDIVSITGDHTGDRIPEISVLYRDDDGDLNFSVYNPLGGALVRSFSIGSPDNFTRSDLNGDGLTDILTSSDGRWSVEESPCLSFIDGRTGSTFLESNGLRGDIGCPRRTTIGDLTGDGKKEIVMLVPDEEGADILRVVRYTHASRSLARVCEIYPGTPDDNAVSHVLVGPDRNRDGVQDLYAVFPNFYSDNSGGAIETYSGATCARLARDSNFPLSEHMGSNAMSTDDLDGDGKDELLFEGASSIVIYSSRTGAIARRIALKEYQGLDSGADLSGDGIPDFFGSSESGNTAILSGANFEPIGLISNPRFHQRIGKLFGGSLGKGQVSVAYSGDASFDINRDGVGDFVAFVPSVERPGLDTPPQLAVISGACPRTVELEIFPSDGWLTRAGSGLFEVSPWVCGLRRPGVVQVAHQGKVSKLNDDGQNGDKLAGDGIFSTTLSYLSGAQQIGIGGAFVNDIVGKYTKVVTVQGVPGYEASAVKYTWFDTVDSFQLPNIGNEYDSQTISLPFPITYYGRSYSTLTIGAKGIIGVRNDIEDGQYHAALPSRDIDGRFIAVHWGDIYFLTGGGVRVKTLGRVGQRKYVISWEGFMYNRTVPAGIPDASKLDFQVVFDEASSGILMNYKNTWASLPSKVNGGEATSGIQENSRLGVSFSHNEGLLPSQSSVLYYPTTKDVPDGDDNDDGGGQNVPPKRAFRVDVSVKYAPSSSQVRFDLLTRDAETLQALDMSKDKCTVRYYGGQGTSTKGLKLRFISSNTVGTGRISRSIRRMPMMARVVQREGGRTSRVVNGYVAADITCGDGRSKSSNVVAIKSPRSIRGRKLTPSAWVTYLLRNVSR